MSINMNSKKIDRNTEEINGVKALHLDLSFDNWVSLGQSYDSYWITFLKGGAISELTYDGIYENGNNTDIPNYYLIKHLNFKEQQKITDWIQKEFNSKIEQVFKATVDEYSNWIENGSSIKELQRNIQFLVDIDEQNAISNQDLLKLPEIYFNKEERIVLSHTTARQISKDFKNIGKNYSLNWVSSKGIGINYGEYPSMLVAKVCKRIIEYLDNVSSDLPEESESTEKKSLNVKLHEKLTKDYIVEVLGKAEIELFDIGGNWIKGQQGEQYKAAALCNAIIQNGYALATYLSPRVKRKAVIDLLEIPNITPDTLKRRTFPKTKYDDLYNKLILTIPIA